MVLEVIWVWLRILTRIMALISPGYENMLDAIVYVLYNIKINTASWDLHQLIQTLHQSQQRYHLPTYFT